MAEISAVLSILRAPVYTQYSACHNSTVHRIQVGVFQDILRKTGNPEVALQALCTTLLATRYYNHRTEFKVFSPAQTVSFIDVQMPVHWHGFWAVIAVVAVHLICVVLSAVLFLRWGSLSLIGEAWK